MLEATTSLTPSSRKGYAVAIDSWYRTLLYTLALIMAAYLDAHGRPQSLLPTRALMPEPSARHVVLYSTTCGLRCRHERPVEAST
jgi:hypothetical protein